MLCFKYKQRIRRTWIENLKGGDWNRMLKLGWVKTSRHAILR